MNNEPVWWWKAYSYTTPAASARAYGKVSRFVGDHPDIEMSCYRFMVPGVYNDPILVVMGPGVPNEEPLGGVLFAASRSGTPIKLPDSVIRTLAKRSGKYYEIHPGFSDRRNLFEEIPLDS